MENLRAIYNQLLALRENLPEGKHVGKKYVEEFHTMLKKLESVMGSSLADYYVKQSALAHTSGVFRPGVGFTGFGEPECERSFLLVKLDAILLMFTSEEKPSMGFHAPNKE